MIQIDLNSSQKTFQVEGFIATSLLKITAKIHPAILLVEQYSSYASGAQHRPTFGGPSEDGEPLGTASH